MFFNNKQNKIDKFWNWFVKSELILRKIIDGESDYIDKILEKLRLIQKGLAVEFEKANDNIIMTISADGLEENFNIVKDIVAKSPQINNWEFIAFRQPVGKDKIPKLSVSVYGLTLSVNKLTFLPITEDGHLYIQIFSDLLTDENKNEIGYGCLMLLDNIIGEYDCVKKVNGYEFFNLTKSTDFTNDLRPLSEIREFLEEYYVTKK